MKYKIFKFDSRNTGYYINQDLKLSTARSIAKKFNHARVDGDNGFFEDYENGKMTSWSANGHTLSHGLQFNNINY